MDKTLQMIKESKIVAVMRGIPSESIIPVVKALTEGGVFCVEVTFADGDSEKSRDTLKAISELKQAFGDGITLGAGTVMTVDNVRDAANAGASYIFSPNVNKAVISETKKLGLISIPGAMTPTEIVDAREYGADIVKLFPASFLGIEYIKAVRGPIKSIPLIATGGINVDNARSFIDAGCVGVGAGSLVKKELVDACDYAAIRDMAREFVNRLR